MNENISCEYENGIVAFIDILGFGNYIKNEHDPEKVNDLFAFMKNIIYLYSSGKLNGVKIAFFSDSIILTTNILSIDGLSTMMLATHLIQLQLFKNLNLCVRGAVTVGNFYNKDNVVFGGGIISAYENEKLAKHAGRIIITSDLVNSLGTELMEKLLVERDIDDMYYYNFIQLELVDTLIRSNENHKKEFAQNALLSKKKEIELLIRNHIHTPYIDKYLWLITTFNNACQETLNFFNETEFKNMFIDIKDYSIYDIKE